MDGTTKAKIFLINQTALGSLKLVMKRKMNNNNRFMPENGQPMPNGFFRRSLREPIRFGLNFSRNWWRHPQVLYEQRYFHPGQQQHFAAVPINLNLLQGAPTQNEPDPPGTEPSGYIKPFSVNAYKWARKCKTQNESVDLRNWIDVPITFEKNAAFKKSFEFSVMSFNVLAQDLLEQHPYLYNKHNNAALEWQERWKRIHEEISNHRPNIVCLQEVQESHLNEYFLKQLELLGYVGIYKKRTGLRCDGCAIFYKIDSISLLDYATVEFMQPNIPLLNRDNVAIVATFCPKDLPENKFIVATTHLLYNPKRQDVRLAQVQILLAEIERLSFHLDSEKQKNYLPIILSGDFNATPTSCLYKFICKGHLQYQYLAAKKLDEEGVTCQGPVLIPSDLQITDNCQHALLVKTRDSYYKNSNYESDVVNLSKKVDLNKLYHSTNKICSSNCSTLKTNNLFSTGTLSHQFAFKSAYNHDDLANPQATTFQDEWVTVDYIFYSGKKIEGQFQDDNLKLSGYFSLPCRSELKGFKMPNDSLGSDHFCLVAKFLLNTGS
ncbi:unnamed protein product [Ceutorhynchus assimilis]|uniref:Endonuclease/exonuclease/phosphatase domain-containing protein n=1 Tax=Ceutorhynchus assimilis TaxID=467358 RepID=A0A9N9MV21_9CUCU|nr:unnamed protein product [Ceutorhynchus assimilis]